MQRTVDVMKKSGFRFWMSGCAAIISLALAGFGDDLTEDGDIESKPGIWQVSRFDMAQTLQRLEACAPAHGFTVIACWSPKPASAGSTHAGARTSRHAVASSAGSVLVFATRAGGTPVLMNDERAVPDLPLSLRLRLRSDGRAEVLMPPDSLVYGPDLPNEVIRELVELPNLVAQALA